MGSSCVPSETYVNPDPYFPPLPKTCLSGAKRFSLPKVDLNDQQTKLLVTNLYSHDNRMVNSNISCIDYYKNLQKIYNEHPAPVFKG